MFLPHREQVLAALIAGTASANVAFNLLGATGSSTELASASLTVDELVQVDATAADSLSGVTTIGGQSAQVSH